MGNNNYLKICAFFLWGAMAVLSAYLTVESLYLLLEWPKWILWILSLSFFTLSSAGMTMIYDSLNTNNDLNNDKRTPWFIGGLVIVLLFWGAFSFPTNTHSLFISQVAKDVAKKDLTEAESKLKDLNDGRLIQNEWNKTASKVKELLNDLAYEYSRPDRKGFGERCAAKCKQIETTLDIKLPDPIKGSRSENLTKITEYVNDQLVVKYNEFEAKAQLDDKAKAEISNVLKNIGNIKNKIQGNISKDDIVTQSCDALASAYPLISEYAKDKTFDKKVSDTQQLKSVIDTFEQWFKGGWAGRGFLTWLLVSLLIDAAGFIFGVVIFRDCLIKMLNR